MRNNYETAAINARSLFLQWDQTRMIERCNLQADEDFIFIRFLDRNYRIDRKTGIVMHTEDGRIADFNEVMTIYDLLCRDTPVPPEKGVWKAAHALSYAGTASPTEGALLQKTAVFLQSHTEVIDAALDHFKCDDFPIGDHACVFPVFDCMHAVFQFWEGDDEFDPVIRFLWDETAPSRLKFETLWYAIGHFEARLTEIIRSLTT